VEEAWRLLDELVTEEHQAPDDEGYTETDPDVLDDVSLAAEESLPVDAHGTPEALARLAACRSALTLEYYGRIYETKPSGVVKVASSRRRTPLREIRWARS
jgi:hypothetical protein